MTLNHCEYPINFLFLCRACRRCVNHPKCFFGTVFTYLFLLKSGILYRIECWRGNDATF